MKNYHFSAIVSVIVMLLAGMSASAQPDRGDWKERMQSGKIAFLTMEIGLTTEEAQNFWPIYNKVSEDLDKAMYETFRSYMELEKALNVLDKFRNRFRTSFYKYLKKNDLCEKISKKDLIFTEKRYIIRMYTK